MQSTNDERTIVNIQLCFAVILSILLHIIIYMLYVKAGVFYEPQSRKASEKHPTLPKTLRVFLKKPIIERSDPTAPHGAKVVVEQKTRLFDVSAELGERDNFDVIKKADKEITKIIQQAEINPKTLPSLVAKPKLKYFTGNGGTLKRLNISLVRQEKPYLQSNLEKNCSFLLRAELKKNCGPSKKKRGDDVGKNVFNDAFSSLNVEYRKKRTINKLRQYKNNLEASMRNSKENTDFLKIELMMVKEDLYFLERVDNERSTMFMRDLNF